MSVAADGCVVFLCFLFLENKADACGEFTRVFSNKKGVEGVLNGER